MKNKLTTFLVFVMMAGVCPASGNPNRWDSSGKGVNLPTILAGIKKEQVNVNQAQTDLTTVQQNRDNQVPDLEVQKQKHIAEAQKIFDQHDGKHQEGSSEHQYWNGRYLEEVSAANSAQSQIDNLNKAVADAQQILDKATADLKDWQRQLQEIGNASHADWDCFFDGKCGNYGPTPERGKGFVITPNGPTSGAPGIFTPLSEEYKNRHNPDGRKVPPPVQSAPQKSPIEKATDKVRGYFRDIINKAKQTQTRRVASAVIAVRG